MKHIQTKLLLLIFFFLYNFLYAQTAQEIAKRTFPSVVLLVMQDANGQPISLGSGFFVSNDIVATNAHMIKGASSGYAKVINRKKQLKILGYLASDELHDLVLLKVENGNNKQLTIGKSKFTEIGEDIFAIGNPRGLEGTFSSGIISAIRNYKGETVLQITAPISPGSSGGPVINSKGEVIGIAFASFNGGQNLNLAIPSKYLLVLMNKTHILKKLSTSIAKKNSASILDIIGEKSTKAVTWSNFLWQDFINYYSISIQNKLTVTIENIYCIVIFYDEKDRPIDFSKIFYYESLPAGLAKRLEGRVEVGTKEFAKRIEVRVLDFKLSE